LETQERTYGTTRDEEGDTHIRFGDGQTGSRPHADSGNIASHYRRGAGSQGTASSGSLDEKLDRIERIPDPTMHKESRDLGVSLLESISANGDLTTFYQTSVFKEAHLNTAERERLSRKEEQVRPKLEAIITFCDRVDSKTQKKIGLSDSEVRRIRETTVRALQMTGVGICSRCGTVNRPGTKQCQNCGANL